MVFLLVPQQDTLQRIRTVAASEGERLHTHYRRKSGELWPLKVAVTASKEEGVIYAFVRDMLLCSFTMSLEILHNQLDDLLYKCDTGEILRLRV